MPIFKVTFQVTALFDAPDANVAEAIIGPMSLHAYATEMEDGEMVGSLGERTVTEVPADQVKAELEAVGNDGTFFDIEPVATSVVGACPECGGQLLEGVSEGDRYVYCVDCDYQGAPASAEEV